MARRSARSPSQGTGSRNPNSARLGIVSAMLAVPRIGFESHGRRVTRIPSGTPMAMRQQHGGQPRARCARAWLAGFRAVLREKLRLGSLCPSRSVPSVAQLLRRMRRPPARSSAEIPAANKCPGALRLSISAMRVPSSKASLMSCVTMTMVSPAAAAAREIPAGFPRASAGRARRTARPSAGSADRPRARAPRPRAGAGRRKARADSARRNSRGVEAHQREQFLRRARRMRSVGQPSRRGTSEMFCSTV